MTDRDDAQRGSDDRDRGKRPADDGDDFDFADWGEDEPLELDDEEDLVTLGEFEDEATIVAGPSSAPSTGRDAPEEEPITAEVDLSGAQEPSTVEVAAERDLETVVEGFHEEETATVEVSLPGGDADVSTARAEETVYGGFTDAKRTTPPSERAEDEETVDFDVALSAKQAVESVGDQRDLETHAGALGGTREGGRRADEDTIAGPVESTGPGLDAQRAEETQAGGFAGTRVGGPGEDEETVFDAAATERAAEAASAAGGPLPARGGTRGTNQGLSATARDPIAGTAAGRGTAPGAPGGPVELREGNLIADRYELTRQLGKGGMGEVWAARHILLDGMRAIKLIKASISRDPEFRKRFLAEGQAMMRVKHPYVVEVTDLDETRSGRELFMVMEHLKGRPLYNAIRDTDDPISADQHELVRVFKEIADGMQRIHDEMIVHKDLKSDNVFLTRDKDGHEHPKVIDFGLAKRVESPDSKFDPDDPEAEPQGYDPDLRTTLSGTLAYMAPEQFLGRPSSFQSDIYAFGVMMHEAFMDGEYPLPRGGLAHYLELHTQGATPEWLKTRMPDLHPDLAALTDRCMALRRDERPESFREVAEELQWWLDIPIRRARRNRILAISGAFAAVLLLALGIAIFKDGGKATISKMDVRVARAILTPHGEDQVVFLGTQADQVELTGRVEGGVVEASVELDGESLPFEDQSDGETLRLLVDFSGVPDGHHELSVTAESGGPAFEQKIHVDRVAPVIARAEVRGARGRYTNSQNPVVVVEASDESEHPLKSVRGSVLGGGSDEATLDSAPLYELSGLSESEGSYEVQITVTDLAGNKSVDTMTYVWDTTLEPWRAELLQRERNGRTETVLQVRELAGNSIPVSLGEPGTLVARFGAATEEIDVPAKSSIAVDVPDVPSSGLDAELTFTDLAGNSSSIAFRVEQVFDTAELTGAVSAVSADDPLELRLTRSYPIVGGVGFAAHPLRDGKGNTVDGGAHRRLERIQSSKENEFTRLITFDPSELEDGLWRIEPLGLGDAAVRGFELTIDRARPQVGTATIRDGSGNAATGGAWGRTEDLVVEVEVADQSLVSLTLDGTAPETPVQPGRRTYRFRRSATSQIGSFTLAAADAAGNTESRALDYQTDWSAPVVASASLQPKGDGTLYGTNENAVIALDVREMASQVDVIVRLPGGREERSSHQTGGPIEVLRQLPAAPDDAPYDVVVTAVDPAGNVSASKTVRVQIEERKVELDKLITWTNGVNVPMHLAGAGDVLIGTNVFPVEDVYVDETEVTNAQYRRFLDAVAGRSDHPWRHPDQPGDWDHTPPAATWASAEFNQPDQPVVNVAFWDAWAFAAWSGRRLPTEPEWTRAAGKEPGKAKLRVYPPTPLGTEPDASLLVVDGGLDARPAPALVGEDRSPIGCLHMGGNVSEWVVRIDPETGEPIAECVAGGNYYFSERAANLRDVRAKPYDRSTRERTIGFRTVAPARAAGTGGESQ